MEISGLNELREKFLSYFESKGHLRLKSFSLVPQNDKSLLIINSGMAPLKPYFTGQEKPPRNRVATCQKCVRTGDIDEVGKDSRHGTFFEMLGNFSFGDYFKDEAIAWSWEFLTEVVGLDKERLYPSVYVDDDEAFAIWRDKMGIAPERIYKFGKEENFWEHGAGPCGPCSEIYYDRGEKYGCGKADCTVGCECDRFMEVWNNVFTQFNSDGSGNYTTLEKKNIDTGMGLERLALVVQAVPSIFDVDTIRVIRERVCEIAGVCYGESAKKDSSVRLITDHIRSVAFMLSDGILPSNEGRGYVLRRLLRRAARHGRLLGVEGLFLAELSGVVIGAAKGAYPELDEKKEYIYKILNIEESRFHETLDAGLAVLRGFLGEAKGTGILAGENVFKLYDTYGFPVELTAEILEEEGVKADEDGFEACMERQREQGRAARETTTYMGAEATAFNKLDPAASTEFRREALNLRDSGGITAVIVGGDTAGEAIEGDDVSIVTSVTPFYAEMGGQKGDAGVIATETGEVKIYDTVKAGANKVAHVGKVVRGAVYVGQAADLSVDAEKRMDVSRNHTATHLLQAALRQVLGTHVEQAGSMVSAERLRFDFTHFEPVTAEQLREAEDLVNGAIFKGMPVETTETDVESARKMGAMALFGEKYGDTVRVVNVKGFSVELCGGTHLSNTAEAGVFKILSEQGVAAGVRRIEGITGRGVLAFLRETEKNLRDAAAALKTTPDQLVKKAEQVAAQVKELGREADALRSKLAGGALEEILASKEVVNGVNVVVGRVSGEIDGNGLRDLGDKIKDRLSPVAIALSGEKDGKFSLFSAADEEAVRRGANCGAVVKAAAAYAGGSGGGRQNMAQAGVKDADKIGGALAEAKKIIVSQIG